MQLGVESKQQNKQMVGKRDVHLSENSMGVSPSRSVWGSKYHTSQTTAQDVINRTKCIVNDCLHQNRSEYPTKGPNLFVDSTLG